MATTPPSQRPVKTKRLSKHRVPGSTHHTRIEEGKEGHGTGIEINVKMPIRTDHVKGNEATCEPGKMNSKMHQGKELYWVSVKDGTEGEQGTGSTHHQEDKAVEIDPANAIFDSGVGVQPSFLELFAGTARLTGAIVQSCTGAATRSFSLGMAGTSVTTTVSRWPRSSRLGTTRLRGSLRRDCQIRPPDRWLQNRVTWNMLVASLGRVSLCVR